MKPEVTSLYNKLSSPVTEKLVHFGRWENRVATFIHAQCWRYKWSKISPAQFRWQVPVLRRLTWDVPLYEQNPVPWL